MECRTWRALPVYGLGSLFKMAPLTVEVLPLEVMVIGVRAPGSREVGH